MRSHQPLPLPFPLPLLLLLLYSAHLINSTTTTTTISLPPTNLTPNTSPSLPPTPFCLTPSLFCTPPLYTDCTALLTTISTNPSSRRLREFTLTPPTSQSNWQIPSTFHHATCRLTISPLISLEWGSFAEIAQLGMEAVDQCLGPAAPRGKYAAGFNIAGLGGGLGVYLHGGTVVAGNGGTGKGQASGGGGAQSCGRVEEGRVFDVLAAAGVGGSLDGARVGAAAPGEQGLVSTTKRRGRRKG